MSLYVGYLNSKYFQKKLKELKFLQKHLSVFYVNLLLIP